MAKIIDTDGLAFFKEQQDAANEKKFNGAVENLRTALANLGLKIIDDINQKRVQKPEDSYNALVAIYNAIK